VDVSGSELWSECGDGVVPAASSKPWSVRLLVPVASSVLLLAAAGCGESSHRAVTTIAAAQWPQADALFHRDPRWLGSDAAFSVALRDGRILWLFNDTLVATTRAHVRSHADLLRNTVAIERGTDPTTASMRFYWGETRGRPSSFFPDQGSRWFWPQHGIRLGRALVVFLHRVKENPKGRPGSTSRETAGGSPWSRTLRQARPAGDLGSSSRHARSRAPRWAGPSTVSGATSYRSLFGSAGFGSQAGCCAGRRPSSQRADSRARNGGRAGEGGSPRPRSSTRPPR
jgi:hypothetical protein